MGRRIGLLALSGFLLLHALTVQAGEYSSAGVGDTGLHLGNSASSGHGQYTSEERALLRRFHALLCDVDELRDELAALDPELERRGSRWLPQADGQPPSSFAVRRLDAAATGYAELHSLFALALRHNPQLRPLRSELAALAARTRMAGAPEDPMAMLEFMDWPASPPVPFNGLREAGVSIGISQEFASHGKRGLRKLVAGYNERIRQHELASAELALCWEIVQIYYDIAGSRAALRAMDRQIELMGILLELGEKRYALNLTPQAQVLDVQLRLGQMEVKRVEMRTMLRQQAQALAALLGHPAGFDPAALSYAFAYPQPAGLQLELDKMLAQTLELHPDYQRLKLEIEQAGWNTELARREFYPDYRLSFSYGVGRMMQDSVSASIEVPLLFNKEQKQDAGVQEAYAMQRSREDMLEELPNELRRRLATLQSELDMHGELVQRYGTALVPQARLSVESMLAGYATGMMQLDEVFMALERALDAENEYEQQRIHYVHVLADLQVATAGVFDPLPYMQGPVGADGVRPTAEGQPPAAPTTDRRLKAAATGDSGLELPPVPDDSADAPAGDTPFVDALLLPENAPVEGSAAFQAADEESRQDAGAPGSPDETEFYSPFVPKGQEKEDNERQRTAARG